MMCPMFSFQVACTCEGFAQKLEAITCKIDCAWWDEKKKQCAILTLAQKDNSKVSIAR